jgi:hypothetical protein
LITSVISLFGGRKIKMHATAGRGSSRKKEDPQIEAMLKKLDEAILGVAPTSHLFPGSNIPKPSDVPQGTTLSSGSQLRNRTRETVADVFNRFAAEGKADDKEGIANALRYAVENDSIGPAAAGAAGRKDGRPLHKSTQFGSSTLTRQDVDDIISEDVEGPAHVPGGLPKDAEVKKLTMKYTRNPSVPLDTSTVFKKFADTSTLGQGKQPLRDTVEIVIKACGAEPTLKSAYAVDFVATDEMKHAVAKRDHSHAIKADEESRYQQEKMKFDKMIGYSAKKAASPKKK